MSEILKKIREFRNQNKIKPNKMALIQATSASLYIKRDFRAKLFKFLLSAGMFLLAFVWFNSSLSPFGIEKASAATCISTATGNWSSITWTNCASGPQSGDAVQINSGHVVTFDVTSATVASVSISAPTVNNGLTWGANTGTLTVSGTFSMGQATANNIDDTLTLNAGTLTVGGSFSMAGNSTSTGRRVIIIITTGTLNLNGGLSVTAAANRKFLNMTGAGTVNVKTTTVQFGNLDLTSTGGTANAAGTIVFNDTSNAQTIPAPRAGRYFNLSSGNTSASGATLGFALTTSNLAGDLTVNTGAILKNGGNAITGTSTKTFAINGTGIFEASGTGTLPTGFTTYSFNSSSTVRYLQTNGQTILATSYGNLELKPAGSTSIILPAGLATVAGNFVVGDGTNSGGATGAANDPSFSVGGGLTIAASSTFTTGAGTITLSSTSTPLTITGTLTTEAGNIFRFTGNAAVVIPASTSYQSLEFKPAGSTSQVLGSGSFTLAGNMVIGDGTNTGGLSASANNPAVTIRGNLTLAASTTYTKGTNISNFNFAKGGTQTITDNTSAKQDIGRIRISSNTTNTTLQITTSIKLSRLTINTSQVFDFNGANTATFVNGGTTTNRPINNDGGSFTGSTGTVVLNGDGNTDIESTLTYPNLTLNAADTLTYRFGTGNSQTINVTGTLTLGNSSNAITGDATTYNPTMNVGKLSITSAATFNSTSGVLKLTGSGTNGSRPLKNSGTFTQGSGTVEYTGTSASDIANVTSDAVTYNNLIIDPAGTVTHNIGTASSQTFTVNGTLTVGNGSNALTLDGTTYNPTINVSKISILASAIFKASSGTMTVSGSGTGSSRPLKNSGTFTQGSGTVAYTSTTAAEIASVTSDSVTYNNLTINPAGTVTHVLGTATTQTFTVNGNFTIGNSTNAVTIDVTTYDPIVNVGGNLVINASAVYTASNDASKALTIGDDFTNNGTFTHNSGAIIFNNSANVSTIGGTTATTFNNFTSTTTGKSIKFKKATAGTPVFTFAGTVTLTGGSGVGEKITLRSDTDASRWIPHFNVAQSTITYTTITDSGCDTGTETVTLNSNSVDGGNNGTCWVFPIPGVTVSGVVYADDSASPAVWSGCGGSSNIAISVNGGVKTNTTCNASTGIFSFSGQAPAAGNIIVVYLDTAGGDKGAIYTRAADGVTNITSLSLTKNFVRVRHENSDFLTNSSLGIYDKTNDADIPVDVTGTSLVGDSGVTVLVEASKEYAPNGDSEVAGLKVKGTYTGRGEELAVGDINIISGGTFYSPKTLTLTGNLTNNGTYNRASQTGSAGAEAGEGGAALFDNGYAYRRAITINSSKVPSTQTNFPMMVSGVYADLATTGNGGAVQNGSGYDVIFTSDAEGTTLLNWETEKYVAATGEFTYWVKIPSMSSSVDTVFYMFYGNASISTDQSTKTSVWDSDYKGVWHLSDNAASTTVLDSTSFANVGSSAANTSGKTATGKVGSALTFNGSSDRVYTDDQYNNPTAFTISAWIKTTDIGGKIIGFESGQTGEGGSYDRMLYMIAGGKVSFGWYAGTFAVVESLAAVNDGNWHYIVGTHNGVNTGTLYVDGVSQGSNSTGAAASYTGYWRFGYGTVSGWGSPSTYFTGQLDDARVSHVGRSANWIAAEYNNQSFGSGFYTFGTAKAPEGDAADNFNGFSYRRAITIDRSKVPSTQTNFPMLISGTYSYLATVANGGKVQNANGYDIGFFSDAALTTALDWEVRSYNATTGAVVYWVEIPSLSASAETVIYMGYGNSAITTDQSDQTGTWRSSFNRIYHLDDGSSLSGTDSTSNNATLTNSSASATNTNVKVNGGVSFNGSSSMSSTIGGTLPNPAAAFTIRFWGYNNQGGSVGRFLSWNNGTTSIQLGSLNGGYFLATGSSGDVQPKQNISSDNSSGLHRYVLTFDGVSTYKTYRDGVDVSAQLYPASDITLFTGNSTTMYLGQRGNGSNFNGNFDEVWLETGAISANEALSDYYNQNSASTFSALGAEEEPEQGGGGGPEEGPTGDGTSTLYIAPATTTTIDGSNNITFHVVTVQAASGAGKSLKFKSDNQYTFMGNVSLAGQTGNLLALSSTVDGAQWFAIFNGLQTLSYLNVKDSGCFVGNFFSPNETMTNAGNNGVCWGFIIRGGGSGGGGGGAAPSGGEGSGGGTPVTGGENSGGGGTGGGGSSGGGTPVGGGSGQGGGGQASP